MQPNLLTAPTGIAVGELNQSVGRRMSLGRKCPVPSGNLMVSIDPQISRHHSDAFLDTGGLMASLW